LQCSKILLCGVDTDFTDMPACGTHKVGRANMIDDLVAAFAHVCGQARSAVGIEGFATQAVTVGRDLRQSSTEGVAGDSQRNFTTSVAEIFCQLECPRRSQHGVINLGISTN